MIAVLATLAQPVDVQPEPVATPDIAWSAIMPPLVLVGGALLLMVASIFIRRRPQPGAYALFTTVVASCSILAALPLWERARDSARGPATALAGSVGIDAFSVFVTVLIGASVILTALLADGYLRREGIEGPELYVLLMLSAAGGVVMASANDLIVLFLGLEILSIAAYVMAAIHRKRLSSQEAGVKYFVLGAFSTAFLLYGIAFVYGATGSTNLVRILEFLTGRVLVENGLLLAGMALLLVGLGFKVAAVPFHAWTPDVYQGSPSPVVAYMASGVKVAGFAGLLRVFFLAFESSAADWQPVVYALAVLSLVVGAVLAVVQTNVKRMLAYSSISHVGFMLVGVQVASDDGVASTLFYLAAYTFMVVGSFAVVTLVGRPGDGHHRLSDYHGLARSRPGLALLFSVFLFAQAGVPLTSGFFAKFYVIRAAVAGDAEGLAVVAMVSAVIAAYLYLRIIVAMYFSGADEVDASATPAAGPAVAVPFGAGLALAVAVVVTVGVGVWPGPVSDWAAEAVPTLIAFTS